MWVQIYIKLSNYTQAYKNFVQNSQGVYVFISTNSGNPARKNIRREDISNSGDKSPVDFAAEKCGEA
jgi:hypothetical protein